MALSTRDSLWTRATADRYDAEEAEASSAAVLEPTLAFLAEPAGDGRALEFAIGTGRVGVPLRERVCRWCASNRPSTWQRCCGARSTTPSR
ncbi:hypothetical protein GCM10010286_39440 [Streptomyces toxytricini]|nr:hypothetical protein GCM10010286_39440 [Streptomyces toxytricini]